MLLVHVYLESEKDSYDERHLDDIGKSSVNLKDTHML